MESFMFYKYSLYFDSGLCPGSVILSVHFIHLYMLR